MGTPLGILEGRGAWEASVHFKLGPPAAGLELLIQRASGGVLVLTQGNREASWTPISRNLGRRGRGDGLTPLRAPHCLSSPEGLKHDCTSN